MKEKNITYTAVDFARYHAGTMPAGEMHKLEKAALEDPFLEDALEGYIHTATLKSDIKELGERLTKKSKKKNVFFLSSLAENKWWRMAAMIVIIAGAGYLFYQVNDSGKSNSLAKNEVKASLVKPDSASGNKSIVIPRKAGVANDSSFEGQQEQPGNINLPQPNPPVQKEYSNSPEEERSRAPASLQKSNVDSSIEKQQAFTSEQRNETNLSQTSPSLVKEYSTFRKKEIATAPASLQKSNANAFSDSSSARQFIHQNNEMASGEYVLKGKVTDENGAPVPFANITDKNRNKTTIADAEGDFSLSSRDTNAIAMVSAVGFASKKVSLHKDVHPVIVIKETGTDLNEVVVTATGKEKKKPASLSNVANRNAAGIQASRPLPHQAGGQQKFDHYLRDAATPLYDSKGNRLTGEIGLSFTLNKQGDPENIKVVKSNCLPCEKEAIKLLKKGPGWPGKKNDRRTVTIHF